MSTARLARLPAVVFLPFVLLLVAACGKPAGTRSGPASISEGAGHPPSGDKRVAGARQGRAKASSKLPPGRVGGGPVERLPAAATATASAAPFVHFGLPRQASAASGGAVATAHPLATRAGAKVLYDGGNALDALVAASFVLAVVTPQSTGLGGGGFAVVVPPGAVEPRAFDFREVGPLQGRLDMYLDRRGRQVAERSRRHGLAVGTPGFVRGLWVLHRRYGKRPWAELVQPAIDIATRGFRVDPSLAAAIAATRKQVDGQARKLLSDRMGRPLRAGAILTQPALARTLGLIRDRGQAGFYQGLVEADLITTVRSAGGKLSQEDLRVYKVRESPPLTGDFRGMKVLTMPQPSAGGAQLLAMAEMMGRWTRKLRRGSSPARLDRPAMLHALVEAMRRSFLLRLRFSGDPDRKATRLDEVFPRRARRKLLADFNPRRATASPRRGVRGRLDTHPNTSHVSIIDKEGMAVASTHTINLYFGSGILAPQSGVFLNNELDDFSFTTRDSNAFGLAGSAANLYRPGRRPVSSMSPTILLEHGRPALVIGSPGGTRIPTTVFQVLWRHIVDGSSLRDAIDAPRLHHQAFPDIVWLEKHPGLKAEEQALRSFGHKTERHGRWCNVQAVRVRWSPDGRIEKIAAASDGRGEGGVMIVR